MSILCVGSVALDSVETPFGSAERVLGGSAVYFAAAATAFHPVRLVGVVGDDAGRAASPGGVPTWPASSRPRARASSGPAATITT